MRRSQSILDRCGNNWLNGKGGCGILAIDECSQTITTAFNPWVMTVDASKAFDELEDFQDE